MAGMIGGTIFTLLFRTVSDLAIEDILIVFSAFATLFTLTAFNERRHRRKLNRTK